MTRASRSSASPLDNLKKHAKRWLKALRANDPSARDRLRRAYPDAPRDPVLRDVQHALARERGHQSWPALKSAVASAPPAAAEPPDRAEEVAAFLQFACWDHHTHGRGDYRMHEAAAARILDQHPAIARDSLYTSIVCGDVEEVERRLVERPELAQQKGGPRQWEPLLYLTYGRLPAAHAADNAVAIARVLLDRGADPNAYYMAGDALYSVLVGIAGEGEQDARPHPHRDALYRLLLERGAGPYDIQVLYNTHFHGDVRWWLELTYAQAVKNGRTADWDDPDWPMFDMGGYGSGARFLLWVAMEKTRDLALAEWLLAHGANPNAAPPRDPRFSKTSLYVDAMRLNFPEMAELLLRYGATPAPIALTDEQRFVAAILRLDRAAAEAELAEHPEYLHSTVAMFAAAGRDDAEAVSLLLDLGTSIEVEDRKQQRTLHHAAAHQALRVARLLVERGADVDPRDATYNNTPLGWAVHFWHTPMIEFLKPLSRDVWNLAFIGDAARLREVLAAEPDRAKAVSRKGLTPLWWLPDDESRALEIVDLFLTHGADPALRTADGTSAADFAARRGLQAVARTVREAAAGASGPVPASPAPPFELYALDAKENRIRPRRPLTAADWEVLLDAIRERRIAAIDANGQMTDAVLERVSRLDHVTRLDLGGSRHVTDEGLRHLARMPQLRRMDLTGCSITDRGLEVLRHLPDLRAFHLYHHPGVTDAGTSHLAECHRLERVALMGTRTGDETLRALAGKPNLRFLQAGTAFTEAGLAVLHEFPAFKTWQGGDVRIGLMEFEAEPTYLLLHPASPFTRDGLAHLEGLDGVFGLNLDNPAVRQADLTPLLRLPNLGWLGHDADDEAMRVIAEMPRLRMLMAQDTVAGDAGFTALSRSASIEYIWGRRCYNLTGAGFAALAAMPALRGLSVSCKNVDQTSLASQPRFPALTEFMPMDVQDEGFRHVGRCERLEALWCMYCRDTSDAATEHIARLTRLKTYYAGQTRITDRSLEILGGISSLERVQFWNCAGVTDAGLRHLARLPRLREVDLDGMANVTLEGTMVFPAHVRVNYST